MQKENDEQRIKRLEGTVDALKFHLESLAAQVLNLELMVKDSNNADISYLIKDTTSTLHTVQNIYPCRRKRNQ